MLSLPLLANMSAFTKAYAHSDLFGKLIILGLVLLSGISWLILIQRVSTTRQVLLTSKEFQKAYRENKDKILQLNLSNLPQPKKAHTPHPYARLLLELKSKTLDILDKNLYFSKQVDKSTNKGIYLSPTDLDIIESHTITTLSSQAKQLERNLFILATIITLAPFLGLLGTVWGILITFSEMGAGASAASSMTILGGISTALVTTVLGLIIAIPALIAYNYLKNALRHYTADMEEFLYELLSQVEIQYRKVDS